MKLKFTFAMFAWVALALPPHIASAQEASQPSPTPKPPEAQKEKSPWLVEVTAAEKIKPGTKDEPEVNPGETILKVGTKFQYTGPQGEIPAPLVRVTDGAGKEHLMLGNLQGTGGFECFEWIISASHARLKEEPKSLASTTIAKCKDAVFYYYFLIPDENPKGPLALVFGDGKPLRLVVKID